MRTQAEALCPDMLKLETERDGKDELREGEQLSLKSS